MSGSIDFMFSQLSTNIPTWASILGGFAIVLAVIFLGVTVFGRNKQEFGAFGFAMVTFIGVLISTLLGLFPAFILIIFLVLSFVIILFIKIFGGYNG